MANFKKQVEEKTIVEIVQDATEQRYFNAIINGCLVNDIPVTITYLMTQVRRKLGIFPSTQGMKAGERKIKETMKVGGSYFLIEVVANTHIVTEDNARSGNGRYTFWVEGEKVPGNDYTPSEFFNFMAARQLEKHGLKLRRSIK